MFFNPVSAICCRCAFARCNKFVTLGFSMHVQYAEVTIGRFTSMTAVLFTPSLRRSVPHLQTPILTHSKRMRMLTPCSAILSLQQRGLGCFEHLCSLYIISNAGACKVCARIVL